MSGEFEYGYDSCDCIKVPCGGLRALETVEETHKDIQKLVLIKRFMSNELDTDRIPNGEILASLVTIQS